MYWSFYTMSFFQQQSPITLETLKTLRRRSIASRTWVLFPTLKWFLHASRTFNENENDNSNDIDYSLINVSIEPKQSRIFQLIIERLNFSFVQDVSQKSRRKSTRQKGEGKLHKVHPEPCSGSLIAVLYFSFSSTIFSELNLKELYGHY